LRPASQVRQYGDRGFDLSISRPSGLILMVEVGECRQTVLYLH